MTLRHEPDPTVADWIVRDGLADDDRSVAVRATQGPPGLEARATVWFDRVDGEGESYRGDDVVLATLVDLAARHTASPERAWFALWDGWGELDGADVLESMRPNDGFGRIFRPRRADLTAPTAFTADVMAAPRADLDGLRSYLLFGGALADVGQWGARPLAPDWPRAMPPASFVWPADHAWCIAADVDPVWCCVGGSQSLVDAVLAHPDLVSTPATYGEPPRDEERPSP